MSTFMRTHRLLREMGYYGVSLGWLELVWMRDAFRVRLFGVGADLGWKPRAASRFSCRNGYCVCWHIGRFSVSRL